jgi:predicted DNA-binding protein
LVYVEPVNMNKAVQIRMPQEWHSHLENIARKRGPGTKVTSLIREAIYQTYPMAYPIEEITALRAAEAPKKAVGK